MHDRPQPHPTTPDASTSNLTAAIDATTVRDSALRTPGVGTPLDRRRRKLRFWAYLIVSGLCALLIPVAVFVAAPHLDDGLLSTLIAWLIATLMGLTVYFSAVATDAAHRLR